MSENEQGVRNHSKDVNEDASSQNGKVATLIDEDSTLEQNHFDLDESAKFEPHPVNSENLSNGSDPSKQLDPAESSRLNEDTKEEITDDVHDDTPSDVSGILSKTMYCFASFGFDAKIAHRFHQHRESSVYPSPPSIANLKFWYGWYGLGEIVPSKVKIQDVLTIRVDGKLIELSSTIRTLHIMNIHCSANTDLIQPNHRNRGSDQVVCDVWFF